MIFSRGSVLVAVAAASALSVVRAECPNACSGHGQCGPHDMCTCDRNWQGSDCSLRTCPFGRAHVDTPKGDLDASLSVEDGLTKVLETGSTVYPYGTTEGYPKMEDTLGVVLDHTAHDYMECSNKGLCDREKGQCECLPGYDGVACQRASCPSNANSITPGSGANSGSNIAFKVFNGKSSFSGRAIANAQANQCSGHGTCMTVEQLAFLDNDNIYDLWDKDSSMGCKCDPGYSGPDCSTRVCVSGIDPLYTDDTSARVTHTTVRFQSSVGSALSGQYAIKFYDITGEDWITKPIDITGTGVFNSKTHCAAVTEALLELPTGVVPSIECSQSVINTNEGVEYTLTFTGNPGPLRQLELDQYLDGSRATVEVSSGTLTTGVHTKIVGESMDYFADRCEGLTVKILADSDSLDAWDAAVNPGSLGYIVSGDPSGRDLNAAEAKKLKRCLGDSDGDLDNNVEVTDWDYGVVEENDGDNPSHNMIGAFPHAVKVVPVESSTGYTIHTPGSYHLVWYDDNAVTGKEFRVANLNSEANTYAEATEMYLYTTKGTVQQMAWGAESDSRLKENVSPGGLSSTRIVGYFDKDSNRIYTNYDTSCQNNPASPNNRNHKCVEKGSKLFVVDSCWGASGLGPTNPIFGGTSLNGCADSTEPNKDSGNIYTVTKVYTNPLGSLSDTSPLNWVDAASNPGDKRWVDTYIIEVDASFGWEGLKGDPETTNTAGDDTMWSDNTGVVTLFHFTPNSDGNYEYVSECSNRGLCGETGLCECFDGYTGNDCSIQSILAKSDKKK